MLFVIFFTIPSKIFLSLATKIKFAPNFLNSTEISLPKPLEAPVIKIFLFLNIFNKSHIT